MTFEALQNLNVFMVGVEISEGAATASILWSQPNQIKQLAGQKVELVEPKNPRGIKVTATLPKDLSEMYTEAKLTNVTVESPTAD
jgi:hypothetical protein